MKPRRRPSLVRANNRRTSSHTLVYVAGVDRLLRPRGFWSTVTIRTIDSTPVSASKSNDDGGEIAVVGCASTRGARSRAFSTCRTAGTRV